MISPPVSVTLCILQSSNCSKMPIQSETPSSLYRLLLGEELWENRDKWRMFRGGFSLENIDTCSTCTLNKKCSLMTCRLRNYDQGNSFYNKPIECAVDYSIAL